jgi:peptide/nickel transport system permease protein
VILRGDLLTTLKSDFILFARSKGFTRWQTIWRHALRPSSITLMSIVGLSVGGLIGGALIVENVFGLSGMGNAVVTAISQDNYLVVQGAILVIAVGFVLVNFLTDVLYGVLDPRIRRGRSVN